MPVKVRDKLESLRAKFFWGGDKDSSKIHWIKWESILASKEKGGIGFGSLHAFNQALLLKWFWRLHDSPNAFWVNILTNIYKPTNSSFWLSSNLKSSGVWGSICGVTKKLIGDNIIPINTIYKQIGNGGNTYFWLDQWAGNTTFKELCPRLYALETDKNCFVSHRWNGNQVCWHWRREVRSGVESDQLATIMEKINPIKVSDRDDKWCWSLNDSNEFTVKSVRKFIDSRTLTSTSNTTRWNPYVPSKVNIFAWRLLLDKLPTRINLIARGVDIPSIMCPCCEKDFEDVFHLMCKCDIAIKVWKSVLKWLDITLPYQDEPRLLMIHVESLNIPHAAKRIIETITNTVWWKLWRYRNEEIFTPTIKRRDTLFDAVVVFSYSWYSNKNKKNTIRWDEWLLNPLLYCSARDPGDK